MVQLYNIDSGHLSSILSKNSAWKEWSVHINKATWVSLMEFSQEKKEKDIDSKVNKRQETHRQKIGGQNYE